MYMDNKNIIESLADIPTGFFWVIKKVLAIITCWALKRRTFYNIVSECLEKGGKQIMNAVNLKEDIIETVEKGNRELVEGNRELVEGNRKFEAKLNIIEKNYLELKEGNRDIKKDNRELKKDNRELKEMLGQLIKNQKN